MEMLIIKVLLQILSLLPEALSFNAPLSSKILPYDWVTDPWSWLEQRPSTAASNCRPAGLFPKTVVVQGARLPTHHSRARDALPTQLLIVNAPKPHLGL
jgi:hypothetical protein